MTRLIAAAISWLALSYTCASSAQTHSDDVRCKMLFDEGAAMLAAEQFPKMQRIAEDHLRICPGPRGAYLLGLAQANMVDAGLLENPAVREQTRLSALRHLRIAAQAGESLSAPWLFTAAEWIGNLRKRGRESVDLSEFDDPEIAPGVMLDTHPRRIPIPAAPPPQPQPTFPAGPVVLAVLGVAGATTGIVLGVGAADRRRETRRGAKEIIRLTEDLSDEDLSDLQSQIYDLQRSANTHQKWSNITLVAGGSSLVIAAIWYFLLPPQGKWRWAATPTGVQATVMF